MTLLFFLVAQTSSPYALSPIADPAMVVSAGLLWAMPELLKSELVPPAACPCDPAHVNLFDRLAIGLHSRGASTTSDVLVAASIALPVLADALDVGLTRSPAKGFLADIVVMAEALSTANALNGLVKMAAHRPRPLLYAAPGADELVEPDNALSFYSSHATTAFAMASAYSYTFIRRHPTSVWRYVVPILAGLLATAVASLRVVAGKHFPTDVITGALVGAGIGVLVPFAHEHALRGF